MFKNLKSLFIQEDDSGKKKKAAPKPVKSVNSPPTPQAQQPTTSANPLPTEGKVRNKFLQILFQAMEKNNLEGIDYLEYKQSLKSLEKMPMDEATRYKSAFAMAQAMGATPDHLIQTASHYLKILAQEENKFEAALGNQRNKQIGEKVSQVKHFEEVIQQKTKKIQELTAEIEKHQADMAKLREEVSNAGVKMETTKSDFIASYQTLVAQIQQDVNKMKQYLK